MEQLQELAKLAEQLGCGVKWEEPMSRHTTFKVGGPAELMISPCSEEAFARLIAFGYQAGLKMLTMGNGSNFLAADEGIRGVVFCLGNGMSHIEALGEGVIACEAGASLSKLCQFAQRQGLSGLEFAYGIPGTAGGAAFMNAGAYGGEMKDVLTACRHITPEGAMGELRGEALGLSYRHSNYSGNGCVITRLFLRLNPGDPAQIKEKMEALWQRRKEKQPLEYPSAGSTFKRPAGHFAGTLIERCGLKGKTVGGAQVSEKHAGFLINTGRATCRDILDLAALVSRTVEEKTGVKLEMEIRVMR